MSAELTEIIPIILGSSLLTGIVTSLFSKFSKDKDNKLQYITNERKKWRDDLRMAVQNLRQLFQKKRLLDDDKNQKITLFKLIKKNINRLNKHIDTEKVKKDNNVFTTYSEVKTFFQCRLNPTDKKDNYIISLFKGLDKEKNNEIIEEKIQKIETAVSSLLKYDWERAKNETSNSSGFAFYLIVVTILYITHLVYVTFKFSYIVDYSNNVQVLLYTFFYYFLDLQKFIILISLPFGIIIVNNLILKILGSIPIHNSISALICFLLNIPYRKLVKDKKKEKKQTLLFCVKKCFKK